jgi:hypothetical protein
MDENPILDFIKFQSIISSALADEELKTLRHELAAFTSEQFRNAADELRIQDKGNIEISKAVSIILKIASSLTSGANKLFLEDNAYSAAALVRQLVEIEYLAWAFENNENEARKWMLSSKEERMQFFTPAKLRKAAEGKFRSKDYGYHCELGGHPVPDAERLIDNSKIQAQLLLSDMLGHLGRIWNHIVGWADGDVKQTSILSRKEMMIEQYVNWKTKDITTRLPSPP